MAFTGRQYEIAAGEHSATVVEVGAGLRRYRHGGSDVTADYGEQAIPPRCCGAVLVPWPNRIRGGKYTFEGTTYQLPLSDPSKGNAIHGLARWSRWDAVTVSGSAVTLAVDLVPQTGWLFELHVEVTYSLDADNGLSVTTTAVNNGVTTAPFGAGFHPYLALHGHTVDEATVLIPARQRLVLDDAGIPVGGNPVDGTDHDLRAGRVLGGLRMDDGFADVITSDGRGVASVRTPSGGAELWFDDAFDYLQVFTQDALLPGLPAIAIEPMTCAADAFNSGAGLILLEPSAVWTGSWGITPIAA